MTDQMTLNVMLFLLVGCLLMALGAALTLSHYRKTRGTTPAFPSDDQMRRMMRGAFAAYVLIIAGHAGLSIAKTHADHPATHATMAG